MLETACYLEWARADDARTIESTKSSIAEQVSITNRFGMTFRLVAVDRERDDHEDTYPDQSYYLQETRLTYAQHSAFRNAAMNDKTFDRIDWGFNSGHPNEWMEWIHYAEALSEFDRDCDYRLPSKREWTFACKNGYEQNCDSQAENIFGIDGLKDTGIFIEVVSDRIEGKNQAIAMGQWINNWGEHNAETKPDCSCEYWTACNPTADDSLNEIFSGRFVLVLNHSATRPIKNSR